MKVKEDMYMCKQINKRDQMPNMKATCKFKDMGLLVTWEKIILSNFSHRDQAEKLAKYNANASAQGQQEAYMIMKN